MRNLVFTGRFQPLHLGHINTLKNIKHMFPNDLLIICIIRNTIKEEIPLENNSFYQLSKDKQQSVNNPLPNWNRYMLLKLAIDADKELSNNTIILFRDRSDIDWEKSIKDLPDERVFLLPSYNKESFDQEKLKYYQSKNEKIEFIQGSKDGFMSATDIRNQLKNGNYNLEFLPDVCKEYFKNECLKYFIE